jgi:transposase
MSNKKVSRTRRKYDVTFKDDVIKMVAAGRPIPEVSQALGVSASLIHRWYKSSLYTSPGPLKSGGLVPASHATIDEIERLKGELRRTEQERDILKKALGIFSRGT